MRVERLIRLEKRIKDEVNELHRLSFPEFRLPLSIATTYVYFNEDSNLMGYCNIDNPGVNVIAEGILKLSQFTVLKPENQHYCEGLYMKYIGIKPQFQRQGFGTFMMYNSIDQARNYEARKGRISSSSVLAIPGSEKGTNFLKKHNFIIIKQLMQEDYNTGEKIFDDVCQKNV